METMDETPDLATLVERCYPEPRPRPAFHPLWLLLGVVLLLPFGPITLFGVTLTRPSAGTWACFAGSILPGVACVIWAAIAGRRADRRAGARYPERRAELLAGRVASFALTTSLNPTVFVALEDGDEFPLAVHHDDCIYVATPCNRNRLCRCA